MLTGSIGFCYLRIDSGHEVSHEALDCTVELDGHSPGRIDRWIREQVYEDVSTMVPEHARGHSYEVPSGK